MGDIHADLRAELASWREAGLGRELALPTGIDLSSNDYLDLARHPEVVAAARAALDEYGAGSPSARLLRGHLPVHAATEQLAAEWLRTDAALLLSSGWHANLAVLGALTGRGDVVVSDARNHASLVDACRLSRARVEIHAHHDPEHVDALLRRARGARRRVVVVESVESTGGECAPLPALAEVCRRHDAWMIVDEAHAAGLFGPEGAGLAADPGVLDRVLARVVTGGKALGVGGAFVAGSQDVIDAVVHRGRPFVFTTAVPPTTAAALAAAIRVARTEGERARRAHAAADRMRAALAQAGLRIAGASPIVPVVIGDPRRAVAASEELRARGFDVRALRPPTVPAGTSRLRIVCRAGLDDETIDAVADAVREIVGDVALPAPTERTRARVLGVVGTDTGVGKTVVSALLCRAVRREDGDARYLKLVQTGDDSDTATVRELAELAPAHAPDPVVALPLPASVDQAALDAGVQVSAAQLVAGAQDAVAACPEATWIVEGAGGLLVPLNDREDLSDVLQHVVRDVVLVGRSGLGTLNHTLLTVEAIQRRRMRLRAVVVVGPRHEANERTLRERLDVAVVALPWLDCVSPQSLNTWLEASDLGEVIP